MKKIDFKKVKRILIIKPRAIGDVILSTPFVRALKKHMPDAEIDFMIEPFAAPAIEGNPNISRVILMHRHKNPAKELPAVRNMRKNELKKENPFVRMNNTLSFYMDVRKRGYSLVFDLWGNMRTALTAYLSGAPYRAGFDFRMRKYLYNIVAKRDGTAKYNALFQMDLLKAAGIPGDGGRTEIFTSESDDRFADDYFGSLKKGRPVIALNALGSWPAKKWPAEKFALTADLLAEKYPEAVFIIIWGPGEKPQAEALRAMMKKSAGRADVIPETTLKQLAAVLKKADVLITNDAGPKHIAVAAGTPTVTIFGATDYRNWGPAGEKEHIAVVSGLKCSPCEQLNCPLGTMECMEKTGAEDVFKAADKILQEALKNG